MRHAVNHGPGNRGREQRFARGDRVDRGDELLGLGALEHEAGRARGQRTENVILVLEGGEHEHPRR